MNKGFWKWWSAYVFFILVGFVVGNISIYCHLGMVPSALEVWVGVGLVCFGLVCWAAGRLIPNN